MNDIVSKAQELYLKQQYDAALAILVPLVKDSENKDEILKLIDEISSALKKDPLLSLSMIVKNEETVLKECLESVSDIVDEIVITDTGSTDNTIKIAEEFGAKIEHFEWCDDFAAARNHSLKQCTGKWILYLDADERLSPASVMEIRKTILEAPEDCGGLVCRIDNAHSLDDTGVMSGSYPRVFKNFGYPKLRFFGKIHEQISPSVFDMGYSIYPSEIVINHTGYNIAKEELRAKLKKNLKTLSDHTIEEPENGYAWYQLGQTLAQMGLFQQSQEALTSALKCGNLSNYIQSTAYLSLSNISRRRRDFETALLFAEKAESLARDKVPPTHAIAIAHLMLGNPETAKEIFIKLGEMNSSKDTIRDFKVPIPQVAIDKGIEDAEELIKTQNK
jgi:glycosyltransferase involved in cell wall biosynthesis